MILDSSTLFTIATGITGLLGVFLVVLWLQERSSRALAWWGVAYLMGASSVMLWDVRDSLTYLTPETPSALLFIACGMIWSGARLFHGREILPGSMFAGALVWLVAVQSAGFAHSEHARVVLSSVIIAVYAFFTAFELRRERRRDLAERWLSVAIPLLHSVVFLAPIAVILLVPTKASVDGLFALFAFQTIIYVVGTAFVVMVMAKERVAHVHKTAAMTDLLTGLFNRRAFLEASDRLVAGCGRKSQPVNVLVFDLDHFKSINDRFGHAVGDEALRVFANTASANMRVSDVIGRLGGEEFAAILPGTVADATMVAERLRVAFQVAAIEIAGHAIGATVSIGIATAVAPVLVDDLLAQADAALYRAKSNGRNRIEIAHGEIALAAPPLSAPGVGDAAAALR